MLRKSLTCWIKSSYLVTQANLILNRSLTSWIELTSLVNQFDLILRKSLTCWIEFISSCESVWLDLLKEFNLYDWINLILLISLTWSFGRVWPAGLYWFYLVDQFHWMLGQVNNLPETGLILWINLTWSCSCRQWHCAIPSKKRGELFCKINKLNHKHKQFLFHLFHNLLSY